MADAEKKSLTGVIIGVAKTTGVNKKGKNWNRAAITIEKEGKQMKIATFNETDGKLADESNGKEVRAVFTQDGQWNNLIDGGLEVIGEVNVDMTEKEGKNGDAPSEVKEITPTGNSYENRYETPEERARKQVLIVRQSSQKLALDYAKLCLDAVEKGILTKDEFGKEDLNFDKILELSKKAETEVMKK